MEAGGILERLKDKNILVTGCTGFLAKSKDLNFIIPCMVVSIRKFLAYSDFYEALSSSFSPVL